MPAGIFSVYQKNMTKNSDTDPKFIQGEWLYLVYYPPLLKEKLIFVTSYLLSNPCWKGIFSKKKAFAVKGSKLFPFGVEFFSEGRQSNLPHSQVSQFHLLLYAYITDVYRPVFLTSVSEYAYQGPIVQSIVSLTSSLVVKMLTVLVSTISN